jgi:hypothetical protein
MVLWIAVFANCNQLVHMLIGDHDGITYIVVWYSIDSKEYKRIFHNAPIISNIPKIWSKNADTMTTKTDVAGQL